MNIVMYALFALSIFTLVKLFGKDSIWKKVLYFNLLSTKFILILVCYAIINDLSYLIDISLVYALLGFVSIVFITRFIRKKGKI